ncbi:MAG: tRNA uracil 4-sulfurtransferase ThiI, partial [Candidatus Binatia bacterium]
MRVLVRYHEIALKGRNRPFFVARLADNLRRVTADLPEAKVHVLAARLEVELPDEMPWEAARERIGT